MKNILKALVAGIILTSGVFAKGNTEYPKVELDIRDQASLQRGAQTFINYCLTCHSASLMRYNRLTDIGLTEDEIKQNLMFTTDKVGDTMVTSMSKEDAVKWFGNAPPDLSTIARSRGADYLSAYLNGFYQDPSRPTGWNNTVLENAAMPHVLWELQGVRTLSDKEKMVFQMTVPGKRTQEEYEGTVRDLVNYLVFMGEPAQVQRHQIGYGVLLFLLLIMLPLSYFLNREYWRDIH